MPAQHAPYIAENRTPKFLRPKGAALGKVADHGDDTTTADVSL